MNNHLPLRIARRVFPAILLAFAPLAWTLSEYNGDADIRVLAPVAIQAAQKVAAQTAVTCDKRLPLRTVVATPDGKIICDSLERLLPDSSHLHERILKGISAGQNVVLFQSNASETPHIVAHAVSGNGDSVLVFMPATGYPERANTRRWMAFLMLMLPAGLVTFILWATTRHYSEQLVDIADDIKRQDNRLPERQFRTFEISLLYNRLRKILGRLGDDLQQANEERDEVRFMLQSMSEAVCIVDEERNVSMFNESARRILDIRVPEPGGKIESVLRSMPAVRFIDLVLETHEGVLLEEEMENSTDKTLLFSGSKVVWEGRAKAIIVVRDMTELRRLERIRSDFVANVSHELRTPLTSIQGYAETLLDGVEKTEMRETFTRIIFEQSKRLSAVIQDLMSLAQIERNNTQIELHHEPLAEIVAMITDTLRNDANRKKMQVTYNGPDDLKVLCNRGLLRQAIQNLVENAVKYCPEGTAIAVEASESETTTHISVRDNGQGIAQEHIDRIFERFYRVDKHRSRSEGGTGLGLAIVKHIASSHNGDISVSSRLGEGTTFTLEIPRIQT